MRTIRRITQLLSLLALLGLLAACSEPNTGPGKVHWDRDTCKRCGMVLSDRHYAVQVRHHTGPGKSKVYEFDDIGCAVVWLHDKPWADAPDTEIWVNDWRNGKWIDARKATYVPDQITPMAYGFGAQSEPDPRGHSFAQVRQKVLQDEGLLKEHARHLQQDPPPVHPSSDKGAPRS